MLMIQIYCLFWKLLKIYRYASFDFWKNNDPQNWSLLMTKRNKLWMAFKKTNKNLKLCMAKIKIMQYTKILSNNYITYWLSSHEVVHIFPKLFHTLSRAANSMDNCAQLAHKQEEPYLKFWQLCPKKKRI